MEKFHLLSIFYFIINIVIFTSCAAGNDFNDRFEKLLENWQLGDEMETSDSDGSLSDLAESISNRNSKFRRDSTSGESIWQVPVSKIDDDSGNGGRRDLTLDDTGIRYILDRIQARDVNGQTAMTKQTDTFNGKLIPCFIHRGFCLFAFTLNIENLLFCFSIDNACDQQNLRWQQPPQSTRAELTLIYRRRS